METNKHAHGTLDAELVRQLNTIADKWTLTVVGMLLDGPQRFSTLRRSIPGISQKMLTQTLRELERNGLVLRTVYPQIPPRVDYALTPLGATMCEPITAFKRWINAHRTELEDARAAFDKRAEADQHLPVHPLFATSVGVGD